jgi:hypothetical protein
MSFSSQHPPRQFAVPSNGCQETPTDYVFILLNLKSIT